LLAHGGMGSARIHRKQARKAVRHGGTLYRLG
jgi:hypothetical protein